MSLPEPTPSIVTPAASAVRPANGAPNLLVNAASLLGGNVLAKGLSLISVLLLTRALGVADFGRYSLLFSMLALLNTLVDFGVTQILSREIAREPTEVRSWMESAFWLRLIACVVFLPPGLLAAGWLGLEPWLVLAIGLGLMASFEQFYDAWFTAAMRLDAAARTRTAASIGNLLLLLLAVVLHMPLPVIALVALLNPVLKLAFDVRVRSFTPKLHAPDWQKVRQLLLDGWPLWLMGLQYIVLTRVDTFLLQILVPDGSRQLGLYAASFRFSEVLSLLVGALSPALLPLLVKHLRDTPRIRSIAETGNRLLLAVVISLSLLVFWGAPWIAALYGPGYEPTVLCMRILIGSQALVAVDMLCYQLLMVYNVQGRRPVIISSLLVTLLNIGLNLCWIPSMGAVGASWATVVTALVSVITLTVFLRCYTPLRMARDLMFMELLALAACVPGILLGAGWGWVSIPVFIALCWGFRLLRADRLSALAAARLETDPPS